MANEVVKYNNDMNTVALRKFNKTEMDIFIAICSKMRDKGLNEIEFDFNYLKNLVNWTDNTNDSFVKMLDSTYNKLIKCNIRTGNDLEWTNFVLFTKYKISKITNTVSIKVNTEFRYILNELTSNFTSFELEEFLSFKSSYTKAFFKIMKQFRNTGLYRVSLEEFRRVLDIPVKYKMHHIDERVLKPILDELKSYKLTCKKIYKASIKAGRPKVVALEFSFKKEKLITEIKDITDEELEERLNKATEKALKEEENKIKVEYEVLTLDKLNESYKDKYIMIYDKFAEIDVKAYITSITRENDKVLINIYTENGKNISLKKESLAHANNYIKSKINKYSVEEK